MFRSFLLAIFLCIASLTHAGEFNKVLSIGDPAPAWKNLPGVDGEEHSLADLAEKKLVLVVFTCNSCPVARDYEDRTIAVAKKYEKDLTVVAINVNRVPDDSFEEMQKRSEEKKFPYSYLFDKSQEIAERYGAAYTPEFFLLDAERKVVYMGGMDDSSYPDKVKTQFVEPAIEAALQGKQPQTAETIAQGCRIRFIPKRRR